MQTTPPLVFITGASSGIGEALAQRFAQAGYRLALVARRTEQMQAWADAHQLDASRCRVYGADVSQIDSIVAAGQHCLVEQGLPDVVIANAGISVGMDTAEREDLEVMSQTFALNNTGLAATFHPFVAGMRQRGSGRLVGIASVAAIRGLPGHGAYCASKAGVVAYCESLRTELHGSGVRVVTLCPGYIDTPLTRGNRYGMPFLMRAEDFADRAFQAIDAGHSYRVIPWQMGWVARIMRWLPNALYDRAVQGRGRKKRKGEA
ncbi:SDR family oxidoreductase [Xenophilus arseniciresistens]|uniref:SDR family oxidoreductase n=1 Tax=Xenophilus arseniciresistens TaxID=1283306 RepID=A0AAE3NBU5_9BURK|nr:SDR family oxidoreductase [Xenophilus arseniciresistens]MDA7418523.1 SDR family oxidoreductase [Xenophilus arseniciresistens]